MSVSISSGGGGGGITIETDPTALKKASNLADLTNVNDAKQSLSIHQYGGGLAFTSGVDATTVQIGSSVGGSSFTGVATNWEGIDGTSLRYDGIYFADGTVLSSAAAAGGIALNSTNTGYIQLNGGGGSVVLGYDSLNNLSGFSEIFVNFEGAGTRITTSGITFPDGTSQATAYTGGGGGGGMTYELRLADSICPLINTISYQTDDGGLTYYFSCSWASAYSSTPAFLVWYGSNAWGLRSQSAGLGVMEHPVTYLDGSGFITTSNAFVSDNWYLSITQNFVDYQNSFMLYSTV